MAGERFPEHPLPLSDGPPRRRVLIVEDDADQAVSLALLLASAGYDTVSIPTGFEAEEAAATERFDAILLDLMLSDRDGVDVARNLRRRRVDSVIIMITGLESLDSTVLGLDMGADDYVIKPYVPEDLLARLRAKLALTARTRERPDLVSPQPGLAIDIKQRPRPGRGLRRPDHPRQE